MCQQRQQTAWLLFGVMWLLESDWVCTHSCSTPCWCNTSNKLITVRTYFRWLGRESKEGRGGREGGRKERSLGGGSNELPKGRREKGRREKRRRKERKFHGRWIWGLKQPCQKSWNGSACANWIGRGAYVSITRLGSPIQSEQWYHHVAITHRAAALYEYSRASILKCGAALV